MKVESNIFKRNFQAFLFYTKHLKDIDLFPVAIYLLSFVIALLFQSAENLGLFDNLLIATLASILSLIIIVAAFAVPLFIYISQTHKLLTKKKATLKEQVQTIQKNFLPFLKQLFFFFKYLLGIPAIVLFIVVIIAYIDPLIGQLLFPIAVLFSGILTLIRTPKSIFAPILAATSKPSSKTNIEKSQELTKGKWWRIFGNILFISILAGTFNFVFFFGQEAITYFFPGMAFNEINSMTITVSIYNIITKTFVIGFVVTAFSFLYRTLKK